MATREVDSLVQYKDDNGNIYIIYPITKAENIDGLDVDGLLTAAEKVKLRGIEAGATKTVVDATLSDSSENPVQNKAVKAALGGKADTTHSHSSASASAAGFMSAADKSKLDGITEGATKIAVDSALSTSSANPVQNKVVKAALDGKSDTAHSHGNATSSAAGFMSAADKSKLDGIEAGANKTTVDTSMSATSTNPVQNKIVQAALDKKLSLSGGTMTGAIAMSGNKITGLGTPTLDADAVNKLYVDENGHKGREIYYAQCLSAATTTAKTATTTDESFTLEAGVMVVVNFHYGVTGDSEITLDINGTGAKSCAVTKDSGDTRIPLGPGHGWSDGAFVIFLYDGTYWIVLNRDTAHVYIKLTDDSDVSNVHDTVYAAYTTGKEVLCEYNSVVYRLTSCTTTAAEFYAVEEGTLLYLTLNKTLSRISTGSRSTDVTKNTVTLAAANWTASGDGYTQTVTVSGVSATETDQLINVMPASASRAAYGAAGVYASAQAANKLTFNCAKQPTAALTAYVVIQEV